MCRLIIERDIPKAGSLERAELKGAAAKSDEALAKLAADVQIKGPHSAGGSSVLYEARDAFAQRRFAPPGAAQSDKTLTIESDWLTAVAFAISPLASGDGAGTVIQIRSSAF